MNLRASPTPKGMEDLFGKSKRPTYQVHDQYHGRQFWSENAVHHESLNNLLLPIVLRAIEDGTTANTEREPFVVCDYGSGDGGTSMKLMTQIIDAVRKKYGKQKPIVIVYEDQPWNDFKSLFYITQGLSENQMTFPETDNLFFLASGTSFYKQCLPSDYVNLGLSTTAMHWLSKRSCTITHDLLADGKYASDEEVDAYKRQAALDWETILLNRASELKPGAHLTMVISATKDGMSSGQTGHFKIDINSELRNLWMSFVTTGRITREEFVNTNFALKSRSEEELKAPFLDENSKVFAAGLKLISIEVDKFLFDSSFKPLTDKAVDDQRESMLITAKRYVNTLRCWTMGAFLSGLDARRSEDEKISILNELFDQYLEDFASNPDSFGYDLVLATLDILKVW